MRRALIKITILVICFMTFQFLSTENQYFVDKADAVTISYMTITVKKGDTLSALSFYGVRHHRWTIREFVRYGWTLLRFGKLLSDYVVRDIRN